MITKVTVSDRRFPLEDGAGADAIHTDPVYAYAVCESAVGPADGPIDVPEACSNATLLG
ncbi:MAG: hypothetical protein WCB15_27640 [Desulfobacterales bacterium]